MATLRVWPLHSERKMDPPVWGSPELQIRVPPPNAMSNRLMTTSSCPVCGRLGTERSAMGAREEKRNVGEVLQDPQSILSTY